MIPISNPLRFKVESQSILTLFHQHHCRVTLDIVFDLVRLIQNFRTTILYMNTSLATLEHLKQAAQLWLRLIQNIAYTISLHLFAIRVKVHGLCCMFQPKNKRKRKETQYFCKTCEAKPSFYHGICCEKYHTKRGYKD